MALATEWTRPVVAGASPRAAALRRRLRLVGELPLLPLTILVPFVLIAVFAGVIAPAVQFRRVYFQRPRHFRRWLPALQPLNRSHFELFRKLPSSHHSSFPFR